MPVFADREMSTHRSEPSVLAAAFLAAAVLALFLPWWSRGLSPFWGDLTYLHFAWRAAPAQLIQAGRAPLWEPSLYLGMPMAASMQGGLFYPPGLVYDLFGFATATALFQALHMFWAGWLGTLCLRRLRAPWGAAAGGGAAFALGGLLIARLALLNHLAVLSWAPAFVIFFRRPHWLALTMALAFLAGYPPFLPGLALSAWLAAAVVSRRTAGVGRDAALWMAAAAAAALLAGVQLLPALELAAHSRRAAGVPLAEALTWSFSIPDLARWVFPARVGALQTANDWWKCVYLGFFAAAAAVRGLAVLPRRRALGLGAALIGVVALVLGGSSAPTRWIWTHLFVLRYVRYPGNLAYLSILPLLALVAAGLTRARAAPLWVLALVGELVWRGWTLTPVAPRSIFRDAGPLVEFLQSELGSSRYLISPRALEADSGRGVADWKERLYGLTNAPYRLRAVANFGEPLTISGSYAFMDRLYGLPGAAAAAAWMPWAGASVLLTPEPVPPSPALTPEGRRLWFVSRAVAPVADAYWLTPEAGAALPVDIPAAAPRPGRPLPVWREREDRLSVGGEGEGWVFLSEPRYPGWRAQLETQSGRVAVEPVPALGAFQKFRVPSGRWTLRLIYDPASWRFGVVSSLLALLVLGAYWYHRASRLSHVA